MHKKAIIVGSTGLVGSHLLTELLANPLYEKVYAILRRDIPLEDPRLVKVMVDFDHLDTFHEDLSGADAFCCLGTTMSKAKSRAEFYKVDFEYCLNSAKLFHKLGATHFLFVSAIGADPKSLFFYSRVKGTLENAIKNIGFARVTVARPSLLLGDRAEIRPMELLASYFTAALIGPLQRYRGIHAARVAKAMQTLAHQNNETAFRVIESSELDRIGCMPSQQ